MPSAHRTVCYDDSLSVSDKCSYALAGGLAGVMIWALGQDVIGSQQPLLEAIGKGMGGATDIEHFVEDAIPGAFRLEQNFPNPFNPATEIRFELPQSGDAALVVHDVLGREVAVLAEGYKDAGRYQVTWDGSGSASGVYVVRLTQGSVALSRRMLLVR
jgi:hypothetical protein